ncbi:MAG: hypothetical protein BroJett021_35400 [Chloroflexota bacterium]|nr:MAG: hypothetical protein BroJett021_35400 [Chloroflexota bacterium]
MIEGPPAAIAPLLREAGGHRWQRVPPTERRGRVHTSTVTVAVFEMKPESEWRLRDADIEVFTTKDSGPGGQHRNKTESCVVMRHKATGIEAKAASKSQHANRRAAREELEARVAAHLSARKKEVEDARRREMVGSGERGDKIRTYRERDNIATDHRTGKKARLSDVLSGRLDLLDR